jgi:chromosome segregation ATPase
VNTNIPLISDSLKKTLRELSGLKDLADALDGVASIQNAEAEARKRTAAAGAEAEAAKAEAAAVIAQAREDADRQLANINADIEGVQATRRALADEVAFLDARLASLNQQTAEAEAKLVATRAALASLAARIGE